MDRALKKILIFISKYYQVFPFVKTETETLAKAFYFYKWYMT